MKNTGHYKSIKFGGENHLMCKKKKTNKKTKTNELKFEEALPVEDASGSKLLRT